VKTLAGKNKEGLFEEKITPFLKEKLEDLRNTYGSDSSDYLGVAKQYLVSSLESIPQAEANRRHWEADLVEVQSSPVRGIERLYEHSVVIEPTMICAAHCRYCLRGNYDSFTLSEDELRNIALYVGSTSLKSVTEVLITGGDPLLVPKRLDYLLNCLTEYAPNVKVFRIATRLPTQEPMRVNQNVIRIFASHIDQIRIELATQINHPSEFFTESVTAFRKISDLGIRTYSQNVLLKGVNDDVQTLITLYNKLRELGIEPYYLFHSVPLKGMHHFRTTVSKGLELIRSINNSGRITGRTKPTFAIMSDVGKVILYEGTILKKDIENNRILLQTNYSYEERLKWNPNWRLPNNAEVDENGLIRIWYLDGEE